MSVLDLVLFDQSNRGSAEDLLIFTELASPLVFLWNGVVIVPPLLLLTALAGGDKVFVAWSATRLFGRRGLGCSLLLRGCRCLLVCKALFGLRRGRGCAES